MTHKRRSIAEYGEAMMKAGEYIHAGESADDACKLAKVDIVNFLAKLAYTGLSVKDLKKGARFPAHFKSNYRNIHEERELAFEMHAAGKTPKQMAYKLKALLPNMRKWHEWEGLTENEPEVVEIAPQTTVNVADVADEYRGMIKAMVEEAVGELLKDAYIHVNQLVSQSADAYFKNLNSIVSSAVSKQAYNDVTFFLERAFGDTEEDWRQIMTCDEHGDKCPVCKSEMRLIVNNRGTEFAGCVRFKPDGTGCNGTASGYAYRWAKRKQAFAKLISAKPVPAVWEPGNVVEEAREDEEEYQKANA